MIRRLPPLSVGLFIADLALVNVGLVIAASLRSILPLGRGGALPESSVDMPWLLFPFAMGCWAIGMITSGAYSPRQSLRWFNEALRVVWGSVLAAALMASALYITYRELSRLQFVYFFLATSALLLSYSGVLRISYRVTGLGRPGGSGRILIVGAGDVGIRVSKVLMDYSRWGFKPIGFLDDDRAKKGQVLNDLQVIGNIDAIEEITKAQKVDEIWVALPMRAHDRTEEIVVALERLPVQIRIIPDYFSMALIRATADSLGGIPIVGLREPVIDGASRIVKRAFDVVIAILLLIISIPVTGLIAFLIRLDSEGPIFHRQLRAGENGRPFTMLKFRTMVREAEQIDKKVGLQEKDPELIHKRKDDPRVTRLGRFLRRYSLDELPQLINVLRSEMSMVGPRPELPWLVDQYVSWQRKRFAVPQGITGWWQINGRSDKPMHLNTDDDLYYIYNYSLWLDIWILVRTPFAVISGRGAF